MSAKNPSQSEHSAADTKAQSKDFSFSNMLLHQLEGQRVASRRHAHNTVNVLSAEETCFRILAAEIEVHRPL